MTTQKTLSAIVLCGGRSRRMGQDKASLLIGDKTFLQHTCDIATQVAQPVTVVAAAEQTVTECHKDVIIVRDPIAFAGPLPALQRGVDVILAELPDGQTTQQSVWVTGCDTPFVTSQIIASLWKHQQEHKADAATLTENGRDNPLLAIYQLNALKQLKAFLASGQFRATDFLQTLSVSRLPVETIPRDQHSPTPTSNLNTPDDLNKAFGTDQARKTQSS